MIRLGLYFILIISDLCYFVSHLYHIFKKNHKAINTIAITPMMESTL